MANSFYVPGLQDSKLWPLLFLISVKSVQDVFCKYLSHNFAGETNIIYGIKYKNQFSIC